MSSLFFSSEAEKHVTVEWWTHVRAETARKEEIEWNKDNSCIGDHQFSD